MSRFYSKAINFYTEEAIDSAYAWLCKQRVHFPPDADIWHLRFHWATERLLLLEQLRQQTFQFSPMSTIIKTNGDAIQLWSAIDALVLKAISLVLPGYLRLSCHCTHVKGHGGLKATVNDVQCHLHHYKFVMRTDVKNYYSTIDHTILLNQLAQDIKDRFLFRLLCLYVRRATERGGLYMDIQKGISRGCALSPIIAAYYLNALDDRLSVTGVYYVRYMDDILIMSATRWQLKRAIRLLNQTFNELKIEQAPDKTFIGRIERGFDFLGYRYSRQPLQLAAVTVERFRARYHRLYEQQQTAPDQGTVVLGDYVKRWRRWAAAGLAGLHTVLGLPPPSKGDPIVEKKLLRGPV
ncbi:MAG: reverse transcriptase/maturase family protein [Amphritea sp.]